MRHVLTHSFPKRGLSDLDRPAGRERDGIRRVGRASRFGAEARGEEAGAMNRRSIFPPIALSPSGERIAQLAPQGASEAWRGARNPLPQPPLQLRLGAARQDFISSPDRKSVGKGKG